LLLQGLIYISIAACSERVSLGPSSSEKGDNVRPRGHDVALWHGRTGMRMLDMYYSAPDIYQLIDDSYLLVAMA
jgi:hypothetical protein